jgi:epsilon-lactone hydrolase
LPVAGIVFSPWTDLTISGKSTDTADDPIVDGDALRMMAAVYLDGRDVKDPLASPLYADDAALAKLPPLLIQVGT